MIQSISVCDICGNEMSSSHYHLPAEIKEANKIKFVHMECCSADEIKKNLLSYAQNQIRFYHDIVDLANDTNMKKIKDFEMKYGMYEEVSQGILIDRDTYIAGLISELKKNRTAGIFHDSLNIYVTYRSLYYYCRHIPYL